MGRNKCNSCGKRIWSHGVESQTWSPDFKTKERDEHYHFNEKCFHGYWMMQYMKESGKTEFDINELNDYIASKKNEM